MTLGELEALLGTLPGRYPALLVDRVGECIAGQSARGTKLVTANEPYFQGHCAGYPVMPGVLVLEALVQLSTLLAASSGEPAGGTIRTIDDVRFKRQVVPGDVLMLETRMQSGGTFKVRASVGGETATEGTVVLTPDK
ncbi:MAG: 3-hydroxyacyl-ACP dehydratase FabZ [Burkholderiales bacterium]|nr:3-hydroxyacyl-ACP dehydratase FabZ [Burkholderiales bacterium]